MGLTIWNLLSDLFSHVQLENDFLAIDAHDHTNGHGVQIPTGGIADGAITTVKLADGSVTFAKIAEGALFEMVYATGTSTLASDRQIISYHDPDPGGSTLDLPAIQSGMIIGVKAGVNVNGTDNITIQANGSEVIRGLGLPVGGQSSIVLGTEGAPVLLAGFADTPNNVWHIISGAQDTGWVSVGGGTRRVIGNMAHGTAPITLLDGFSITTGPIVVDPGLGLPIKFVSADSWQGEVINTTAPGLDPSAPLNEAILAHAFVDFFDTTKIAFGLATCNGGGNNSGGDVTVQVSWTASA